MEKYNLMFKDQWGDRWLVAPVANMTEAHRAIKKFLDAHCYKSYYTRYWIDYVHDDEEYDNKDWYMEFDVGSWNESFVIHFPNEFEANQFRNTDDSMKPF